MGKQNAKRRVLTVSGIDPVSGKTCVISLSNAKIVAAGRRSAGQIREAAYLVPMVLQKPSAIFEGLRRDADEPYDGLGWRCYCGVPPVAYDKDGNSREPWGGEVFLVFVNDELVAYQWYWTDCAEDEPNLPADYDARFHKRLL